MTMQRINTHGAGGPDVLYLETTAIPQPQAGEILIKTAYAGVNRPDILQRQGLYPVPEGVTPILTTRSEERRVGKECRSRWSPYH